jgi:glycosidase
MVFYNIFYDCLSCDKVIIENKIWPGGKEWAFHNKSYFEIQLKYCQIDKGWGNKMAQNFVSIHTTPYFFSLKIGRNSI